MDGCKNEIGALSIGKLGKHIPLNFSVSSMPSFIDIKNKRDIYKYCTKRFWECLRGKLF